MRKSTWTDGRKKETASRIAYVLGGGSEMIISTASAANDWSAEERGANWMLGAILAVDGRVMVLFLSSTTDDGAVVGRCGRFTTFGTYDKSARRQSWTKSTAKRPVHTYGRSVGAAALGSSTATVELDG